MPSSNRSTSTSRGIEHGSPAPILLITPKQAAEALAISPRKLWSMTASGEISHVKFGRSVRYPVRDLEAEIERRKTGGGAR